MRDVMLAPLGRRVPVLGFGCASLGSRISKREGLRSLAVAWEHGVRWFDVAPVYGDGLAEQILGEFLVGRRDEAVICTKFGIPRPSIPAWKRMARPVAREIVRRLPNMRRAISGARMTGSNAPIAIGDLAHSLEQSLRNLRTDRIDVLALHESTPQEAVDPAILAGLLGAKSTGRAVALSIAGSLEATIAGLRAETQIAFAQFPDSPFDDARNALIAALPNRPAPACITHSVFGSGRLARFQQLCEQSPHAIQRTDRHGASSTPTALLMDYALSANPDGIVLASMFSPHHIVANAKLARLAPDAALVAEVTAFCGR